MSFIKKITQKIFPLIRKAYVEKIARSISRVQEMQLPKEEDLELFNEMLQEKFSRQKYKVGGLYEIESNRLGTLISLKPLYEKEVFIFIEDKKEGDLVKEKVFYCPNINEYLNFNLDNYYFYNIKEIQDQ